MKSNICPPESDLWPLAVGEPVDAQIRQHVASCGDCSRTLQRSQSLMAELQNSRFNERNTPGSRTASVAAGPRACPERIGRFPVLRQMARGGQATVFRAWHPELGVDVIIKWGHEPIDSFASQRLQQEARLLADLKLSGVARVLDSGQEDGRPYLVLEYCAGRSLREFVATGPLATATAVALTIKICRIVADIHAQGTMHLDLSPDNILIDDLGEPKVLDFGLAQRFANELPPASLRWLAGTPGYMSPEQTAGQDNRLSNRTDVHGLGAILYFLLTGQAPRPRHQLKPGDPESCDEINFNLLSELGVPKAVIAVCQRAMANQIQDRHRGGTQIAEELQHALAAQRRPLTWLAGLLAITGIAMSIAGIAEHPHPSLPLGQIEWNYEPEPRAAQSPETPDPAPTQFRLQGDVPLGTQVRLFAWTPRTGLFEISPITVFPKASGDGGSFSFPLGHSTYVPWVNSGGTTVFLCVGESTDAPIDRDRIAEVFKELLPLDLRTGVITILPQGPRVSADSLAPPDTATLAQLSVLSQSLNQVSTQYWGFATSSHVGLQASRPAL